MTSTAYCARSAKRENLVRVNGPRATLKVTTCASG